MSTTTDIENEIKSWLEIILKNENLVEFSVKLEGNTELGTGYSGDIFFVEVEGLTNDRVSKKYNLVVKCAKQSIVLRSKFPVNCAFLNEMYFYETIFPYFLKFQQEKGVENPFDKLAKCYGAVISDNLEVIAFDNLNVKGYTMWNKTKPLTRPLTEMIIKEFGKFHAISIAIKDQQPEKFQQLTEKCDDFLGKIHEYTDMLTTHEELVDEVYELLQGQVDGTLLSKWKSLRPKVRPFMKKFREGLEGLNVVVHGDCWNNNFMHYHVDDQQPTFAIVDWQMAKLCSPVIDVSFFLFACLSEEDIDDVDVFLKLYHTALGDHLRKLGSNVDQLYPFSQFLDDWKKYSKFGVIMITLIHKFSLAEREEVPDYVQTAEQGSDVAKSLDVKIKDTQGFKKRMGYLVKFCVEHDIV